MGSKSCKSHIRETHFISNAIHQQRNPSATQSSSNAIVQQCSKEKDKTGSISATIVQQQIHSKTDTASAAPQQPLSSPSATNQQCSNERDNRGSNSATTVQQQIQQRDAGNPHQAEVIDSLVGRTVEHCPKHTRQKSAPKHDHEHTQQQHAKC
jgi:hypothetical protein